MNFIEGLVGFLQFFDRGFDDLFFFVPNQLRIFALSLLVLNINKALERRQKKSLSILKYGVTLFFFLYSSLLLIPIDSIMSLSDINWSDFSSIISTVFGFLPYVILIIFIFKLKSNKYVKYFVNYYMLHVYFIIIVWVFKYLYPADVNLLYSVLYVIFLIVFANFTKFSCGVD